MSMIELARYTVRVVAGCLLLGLVAITSSTSVAAFALSEDGCEWITNENAACVEENELEITLQSSQVCIEDDNIVGLSEDCATCIIDGGPVCTFEEKSFPGWRPLVIE